MEKSKGNYTIKFNYLQESEKAVFVQKKTKKRNSFHWIPKSVILEQKRYTVQKSLPEQLKYDVERIELTIAKWFVEKELKFYK